MTEITNFNVFCFLMGLIIGMICALKLMKDDLDSAIDKAIEEELKGPK